MNKNNRGFAIFAFLTCLSISKVFASDGTNALTQVAPDSFQGKIFAPFFDQITNNPASMTVLVFLCVIAFVLDDTPVINSRYVTHITIMLGMGIYWLFAGVESVPHYFPHPFAVFAVNGSVAGLLAGLFHRYAVAYVINLVRAHFGGRESVPENMRFLRPQADENKILSIGAKND